MTLAIIIAYLGVVLLIGVWSHHRFLGTGEDWFVATRTIGPFVLLMSLFGTHMTAFALLGASGESYRTGIGVFALMASSSALVVPALFFFLGTRVWALGKRHGFLTQVQLFRARWGSDGLGLALFVVLVLLLVPYLLIGVMGGGLTLAQITAGLVPSWLGSMLICAVVFAYVSFGGLRGTAWVNTFQTLVFMTLGAVTFAVVVREIGGVAAGMARVAAEYPQLLIRGDAVQPLKLLSYTLIPLSAGMFPHLFMHWLSARRASTFKLSLVAYPICIAIVWVPSVLIGVLGRVEVPGLEGPAASSVLIAMIRLHAPEALAGLLAAGVFAAIMSSLDSQTLALSTMFTHDIVRHYGGAEVRASERQQVRLGRGFVLVILALTWLLSLVADPRIFRLGVWSFTGFSSLLPLVVAVFWRRSTKVGALASLATTVVLWMWFFVRTWSEPGYSVLDSGLMPVAVILLASSLAMVIGSLASTPPAHESVGRFFAGVDSARTAVARDGIE